VRAFITILIIVGAIFGAWKAFEYWDEVSRDREAKQQAANAQFDPTRLAGLPPSMEQSLQDAYKKGASGLKDWLAQSKRLPQIKDPRLAWIELDYVVLISHDNPIEAKRVFAAVKQRTSPGSPVYQRIQSLEKTYE
jgi:hypothetical protein